MITVALSATICAPHERVWRALVDAVERPLWDERVLGEVVLASTPAKSPRKTTRRLESRSQNRSGGAESNVDFAETSTPLRTTRWRFRLGGVPLVMQEKILAADRHDRLVSRVSIGTMHFDQTLTLHSEDDESGPHTRLGMKIVARNSIAVIGDVVPRLDVQKIVIEYVDSTLRQVQKFCEQSDRGATRSGTPG